MNILFALLFFSTIHLFSEVDLNYDYEKTDSEEFSNFLIKKLLAKNLKELDLKLKMEKKVY